MAQAAGATSRPSGEIRVNRIKEITCPQGHKVDISRAKPMSTIKCPQCGSEVRVPAQIGHYLLVKLVARGSNGAVYQAYDEKLARLVALKIIYQVADGVEDRTQEVLREARTVAALNHPNVAQVYSFHEDMDQPFIVMELVDGGRLDQMLSGGKKLDETPTLDIAIGVASGLAAANRLGMTHGDIKPQNILIGRDGAPKLIDFGLSRRFRGGGAKDARIAGTPYYIAPEIVQGHTADHRADMYSLGATLYQALVGRPPFLGKTPMEVMSARLKGEVPEVIQARPEISAATNALVKRLMAVDPAQRPADMEALVGELRAVRQGVRI